MRALPPTVFSVVLLFAACGSDGNSAATDASLEDAARGASLDAAASTHDSGPDAGSCASRTEVCNGVDDDCDGVVDETAAADLDCAGRQPHARTTCETGVCIRFGCDMGYVNCDGDPSNGCELSCDACGLCDDAGASSGDGG